MRIVDRALIREALQASLAVALVFVSLFVVVTLVNVLGKAAVGDLPARLVFTLLSLQTIKVLGVLLPLSFFIGVLLTVGRWYRESEMTVLMACGIGLAQILKPLMWLALGFALVTGLVSFYLAPLAMNLLVKVKAENVGDLDPSGIAPGVFNEIRRGSGGVFYVERLIREGSRLQNVFVSLPHLGRYGVLVAQSGYHYTDAESGEQYLVLEDGTRYDGIPGRPDYRILSFETYRVRIEVPAARDAPVLGYDARPTLELMSTWDRGAAAEWQSRLAKPLSLFLLAVLALVFSHTNPRRGRFLGLFLAILVYFVYVNLIGVGDAMLKQGRIPSAVGLWWVHLGFAGLAAYFFWRRLNNLPLIPRRHERAIA
ncbi:MAG TPA: LPS export ABC transporter permease LptF [Acidiferrobacterales bacterium]|jgi:lipopolysaccharide export system permease protein